MTCKNSFFRILRRRRFGHLLLLVSSSVLVLPPRVDLAARSIESFVGEARLVEAPVCDLMALEDSDSIPPLTRAHGSLSATATPIIVRPILFVPADLEPSATGLITIDLQMLAVQQWYAEQVEGYTFDLLPAQVVRGNHPMSYYFGADFVTSRHGWGYEVWNHVWPDHDAITGPQPENEVIGIFFQSNGVGGAGLGGGRRFLMGLERLAGDHEARGYASQVERGGIAHELGHALGLPHPTGDDFWSSVMGAGFYGYPEVSFVDNETNPEISILKSSGYLLERAILADGGFESCGGEWTVVAGAIDCAGPPASGRHAGRFQAGVHRVQQTIDASRGMVETGGLVKVSGSGPFKVSALVEHLSETGAVLQSTEVLTLSSAADGWVRFGGTVTPEPTATLLRFVLAGEVSGGEVLWDSISVASSRVPEQTLPMGMWPGMGTGKEPVLSWFAVPGAASYRVQISLHEDFESEILADTITSTTSLRLPFVPLERVPYFWRVAAINGSGTGNWSATFSVVPHHPTLVAHSHFDDSTLEPEWLHSAAVVANSGPAHRRFSGHLQLPIDVDSLIGRSETIGNHALRPAPSSDFEIVSRYDVWTPLGWNHSHGGLVIRLDDDHFVALVREYHDRHSLTLYEEAAGAEVLRVSTPLSDGLPIRMVRQGPRVSGYYSHDGVSWTLLAETEVPWNPVSIGLFAGGKTAAVQEDSSIFFDWFAVNPLPGTGDGVVGDANGDGALGVSDIFYLINHLFASGPAPIGSGDANGDGVVSVSDIFYLINHLFAGGPSPL